MRWQVLCILGKTNWDEALTVGEAVAFILRTKGATGELEAGAHVQQEGGRWAEMQWGP